MLTQAQIERTILSVLAEMKPYATPDRALFSHTSAACAQPIVRREYEEAINSLLAKTPPQILCLKKDDGNKFTITAEGEARLGE